MGKESAIKAYYHTRNRVMFMQRNVNPAQFYLFLIFLAFAVVPKTILKYLITGRFQHLKSFMRGTVWNITTSRSKKFSNSFL